MDHQLSNALSTMFLRHLVMFLHFETYALANPQKKEAFWEISTQGCNVVIKRETISNCIDSLRQLPQTHSC